MRDEMEESPSYLWLAEFVRSVHELRYGVITLRLEFARSEVKEGVGRTETVSRMTCLISSRARGAVMTARWVVPRDLASVYTLMDNVIL